MTIREKLCVPLGKFYIETSKELEEIADDYAIDFLDWYMKIMSIMDSKYIGKTPKELLEIYKKEKGL